MPKSQVIEQKKELTEKKETYQFTAEEREQHSLLYDRLKQSWKEHNAPLDYFDGKSLRETIQENRLARNSYLTPIQNEGEVRVVTGVTEGKVDSVFNAVFNQNVVSRARAFDEFDLEDYMLGDSLTKVVQRTKQIERDEDFNESMLREILTMPAVFIEETMDDEWYYDRVLSPGDWDDLWNFREVKLKKGKWFRRRQPKKHLWTADKVFLASMKIPMRLFHSQPYIFTYRTRTYKEAEKIYGHSPRWQYVRPGMCAHREVADIDSANWRFSDTIMDGEVEEIRYKSLQDDEMQIYLNGVPMLPVGCPLKRGKIKFYDMTMEGMKEINPDFAYARPIVSMTKVMQALRDERFRLTILKDRQDIFHPIVTQAKVILSKDMWLPASITYGVRAKEFDDLMKDRNYNSSDDAMLNMIEKEIESFINVSSLFQGLEGNKMTATEAAQRMKQALIMLGASLTSYMRAVRNCDYLRLFNILENMTQAVDTRFNDYLGKSEDVYNSFTMSDVDLIDGKVGQEVIAFIGRKLLPQEKEQVLELSKKSREIGKPKSFNFIDVNQLRAAPLMFYIEVTAEEKRTSLIEKELFKKDIADSIEIGKAVGVPVNPEYAVEEWSKRIKIDPKKMYKVPSPMDNQAMGPQIGPDGQPVAEVKPPADIQSPMNAKQMMNQQAGGQGGGAMV